MSHEIQPTRRTGPLALPLIREVDLLGALLADARNPNTQAARAWDMTVLAQYLGLVDANGHDDAAGAANLFCGGPAGQANAVVIGFKRYMIDLKLASSTINRRLCTCRALVKLARRLGMIDWALEVDNMPEEPSRDMSGPREESWQAMLAEVETRAGSGSAIGARDLAIVRLMHDNGLRCCEVSALDVNDVDLKLGRVYVIGKGRRNRQPITINLATAKALSSWLAVLGAASGPAFVRMSTTGLDGKWAGKASGAYGGGRLGARSLYRVVTNLGKAVGVDCRPHGLRHSGATRLLELTNGDIRAVQRWTRHKNANTVLRYDDDRRDLAGDLAKKLGEDGPAKGGLS